MTTDELARRANISRKTVLRIADRLGGKMIGGRHGWEFPECAVRRVATEMHERHQRAVRTRRVTMAKNGTRPGRRKGSEAAA